MLKGINPLVGPELLFALAKMGHGDELVIVDRNYPAYTTNELVYRMDGLDSTAAADAVLSLFPLDTFIPNPVERMLVVGAEDRVEEVHDDFLRVARAASGRELEWGVLSREEFYDRAKKAYAVLVTGEDRPYGCFIVTKGVLPEFTP